MVCYSMMEMCVGEVSGETGSRGREWEVRVQIGAFYMIQEGGEKVGASALSPFLYCF